MKSHMVTIRMDRVMKAGLDKAAKGNGRSLSGEIQHRLTEYEMLRRFFDWKTLTIAPDCALSFEVTDGGTTWHWAS